MSTLVNAIAEAIYADRNGRGARPFSQQTVAYRQAYFNDARAAIKALAEFRKRADDGQFQAAIDEAQP